MKSNLFIRMAMVCVAFGCTTLCLAQSSGEVYGDPTPANVNSSAAPHVTPTNTAPPAAVVAAPAATPATPATPSEPRQSAYQRYLDHSGRSTLSYLSVGYTYSFMDGRHLMTFSTLDFRVWLLGFNLLSTELSVAPLDTRVAYKPSFRIYIPVAKSLALVPYAGATVDMTALGMYVNPNSTYNMSRDFYCSANVGLSFTLSAAKHVPFDVKVEYRHPIIVPTNGTLSPQGVYLGAQIYFASVFGNK